MTPKSPPEVEQSDREAAASLSDGELARIIRAGQCDNSAFVQAFAANRIAALAKVTDEREKAIVKWARNRCALNHRLAAESKDFRTEHIAISSAYREVAEAIEAGDHLSPQAGEV